MKLLTIFSALLFGFLVLLVFPFLFIKINIIFNLPVLSSPFSKWLGLILSLFGAVIWLSCVGMFNFIGKGTPVPLEPPKKLVTRGIYKLTRNPMYISALIVLLGYFFFFGYLTLLIYELLVYISFHLFIIFYEEPTLLKMFGKKYLEYCQKVPRWL